MERYCNHRSLAKGWLSLSPFETYSHCLRIPSFSNARLTDRDLGKINVDGLTGSCVTHLVFLDFWLMIRSIAIRSISTPPNSLQFIDKTLTRRPVSLDTRNLLCEHIPQGRVNHVGAPLLYVRHDCDICQGMFLLLGQSPVRLQTFELLYCVQIYKKPLTSRRYHSHGTLQFGSNID